ncbi:tail assembly protein [Serratia phage MQ-4]|nr:tail assembly protein [Serratia phage MQ-4]
MENKENEIPAWLNVNEAEGYADITLSRGVEILGSKVTVIRMREPTVADQEVSSVMKGSDAQREIQTFATLCDLAPDDIRKLPLRDYTRLQKAFVNFIN